MSGSELSGGLAAWNGTAFEIQLAVDASVRLLLGDASSYSNGAISRLQLQPPCPFADLRIQFHNGGSRVVQAKSGDLRLDFSSSGKLVRSLAALDAIATSGSLDLSATSLDQAEYALASSVPKSLDTFKDLTQLARSSESWEGLGALLGNAPLRSAHAALETALLPSQPDRRLRLLQKLEVVTYPDSQLWRRELIGLLELGVVHDHNRAELVLDILVSEVTRVAPIRGLLSHQSLFALFKNRGIGTSGRRLGKSFARASSTDRLEIEAELGVAPTKTGRIIRSTNPTSSQVSAGLLLVGGPGAGKSSLLAALAETSSMRDVVVIKPGFSEGDLAELAAWPRRLPFLILWDDIHSRLDIFERSMLKLRDLGIPATVICTCRAAELHDLDRHFEPRFWSRIGVSERFVLPDLTLQEIADLVSNQIFQGQMTAGESAVEALTHFIANVSPTPQFVQSSLSYIVEELGGHFSEGDVDSLPWSDSAIWLHLFKRLAVASQESVLLQVLAILRRAGCPVAVSTSTWACIAIFQSSTAAITSALSNLEDRGWLWHRGDELSIHDLILSAVPLSGGEYDLLLRAAATSINSDNNPTPLSILSSIARHSLAQASTSESRFDREASIVDSVAYSRMTLDRLPQATPSRELWKAHYLLAEGFFLLSRQGLEQREIKSTVGVLELETEGSPTERRREVLKNAAKSAQDCLRIAAELTWKERAASLQLIAIVDLWLSHTYSEHLDILEHRVAARNSASMAIDELSDALDTTFEAGVLLTFSNTLGEFNEFAWMNPWGAQGIEEGVAAARRALEIAEEAGSRSLKAHASNALSNRLSEAARFKSASFSGEASRKEALTLSQSAASLFELTGETVDRSIALRQVMRNASRLYRHHSPDPALLTLALSAFQQSVMASDRGGSPQETLGTLTAFISEELRIRKATNSEEPTAPWALDLLKAREYADRISRELDDPSQFRAYATDEELQADLRRRGFRFVESSRADLVGGVAQGSGYLVPLEESEATPERSRTSRIRNRFAELLDSVKRGFGLG